MIEELKSGELVYKVEIAPASGNGFRLLELARRKRADELLKNKWETFFDVPTKIFAKWCKERAEIIFKFKDDIKPELEFYESQDFEFSTLDKAEVFFLMQYSMQ